MSDEDVKKHITSSDDWGISKFILSNLSTIVKQFHFIAHENLSNSGDEVNGRQLTPTNHWSLFLTLSTINISSVRVEVIPNQPGEPGMLVVESNAFINDNVKTVSMDAHKGITVADVFDSHYSEKERSLHPCTCRRGMSLLVVYYCRGLCWCQFHQLSQRS